MGIGDWGLGIGNPQSPIPNPQFSVYYIIMYMKLLYVNKNNTSFKK